MSVSVWYIDTVVWINLFDFILYMYASCVVYSLKSFQIEVNLNKILFHAITTKLADNDDSNDDDSIHTGHGIFTRHDAPEHEQSCSLSNCINDFVFFTECVQTQNRTNERMKERTKIAPICDGLCFIHTSRTCESSLGQCLFFSFLCVLSFFFFVFPIILSYSPDLDSCVFGWLAGLCSLNTNTTPCIHARFLLLLLLWLLFFFFVTFSRLVHNLLFSSYFVEFLVLKNQREQLYHHLETM